MDRRETVAGTRCLLHTDQMRAESILERTRDNILAGNPETLPISRWGSLHT